MANLLVINGPNLNLLGMREPQHYGHGNLEALSLRLEQNAQAYGHSLKSIQSNSESKLIEIIHQAQRDKVDFIIANPAAYTHTSIALRDALAAVRIPYIEVHISNIYAREPFRHQSFFSDLAVGVISGLGLQGYELALVAAHTWLTQDPH